MASCDDHCKVDEQSGASREYRKILWVCLVANALMFVVQMVASYIAGSVSLLANSADFLSDAANYGISLFVLSKVLHIKAKASIIKGVSLGIVGLWVAFETFHHSLEQSAPKPDIIIAAILAWLALSAAWQIVMAARKELSSQPSHH